MACLTVGAEAGFMDIVTGMTQVAFVVGGAVNRSQMALFTLDGGMHANQGEAGEIVIEKDFFVPAFFVMAVFALLALLALVDIVLSMAGYAVGFHFLLVYFTLVAKGTGQVLVFAAKRKIGLLVVVEGVLSP